MTFMHHQEMSRSLALQSQEPARIRVHTMSDAELVTFWRLLCSYLSTAAISLSSLYARALGTMLWRSS